MFRNTYTLNETENLMDNLEMAVFFLGSDIPLKYKWITKALYDGLVTVLVLGSQRFLDDPIIFGKKAYGVHMKFRNGTELPQLFKEYGEENTLRRLLDPRILGCNDILKVYTQLKCSLDLKHFICAEKTQKDLGELISIRKGFDHFAPSEMVFCFSNIHGIYRTVVEVIESILFKEGKLSGSDEVEDRMRTAINQLKFYSSQPIEQFHRTQIQKEKFNDSL